MRAKRDSSTTLSEEMETALFDRSEVLAALAAHVEDADADVIEVDADDVEELVERITEDSIGELPLDAEVFALDDDTSPEIDLRRLSQDEAEFLAALPPASRGLLLAAKQRARRWPEGPRLAFAVATPIAGC